MLLLLDNYDSFTYNLYQMFSALGAEVDVVRNDCISVAEVMQKHYEAIILSPGPGVPKEAGILEELIATGKRRVPILGVCLGHQGIGEVFGAKVVRAKQISHGKASPLKHNGKGIFAGIEQNTWVGRYHSLILERESLPDNLEVTAELADGTVMGIRVKDAGAEVEGVQFHPESILTPQGAQMMQNFLMSIKSREGEA